MADYIVQIDVDKQYLINSYMNAAKDIKQKAKGEVIEYRIQADEKTFYDSVKRLLSSGKLLKSDIKIGVDTDYYKQSLEKLKSYTGKTVKQIDDSLKKGLSDSDKYSLDNIISEKGWKNQTPDHIRKIIDDLVDDINKSFQNVDISDFKQVDNLLEKAKKLQSVVDQVKVGKNADVLKEKASGTSTYNSLAQKAIKQVRDNYSKTVLQNKDRYISQMETEMGNVEQSVQKNLISLFNAIFDKMGNVRSELSDAISSGVEEGVEKAENSIQDLENRLDKLNKKKESLEANAKNNKEISKSYQDNYDEIYSKTANGSTPRKTDLSKYAESVKEYVATLKTGSEEYNKIKEEYKELVLLFEGTKLSKELPVFENFETYDKLLMNVNKEQLKTTAKIEETKKQQIQNTAKEVQEQTSEINNNAKEINIDINEEQVIKSIQNIKEEINSLPDKKEINIKIIDNDDKIESEKEIEVRAKLSKDVNNSIQEELNALEPPTVKIDPELSEGFASKLQSKIDNIKDVKVKLKGSITSEGQDSRKKTSLSEEEKTFNSEADNLIKEFSLGSPITNKSQSAIREKLKDIIRKKQQNQEYNLDEIFNILSSDQTFLEDRYKHLHPDYYNLKSGLKNKTLRYSDVDVAEFATPKDFQQARAKIGLKKLLPNQGQDPTEFLKEIGVVNDELKTTQDAIKYIYDMLSNPPDLADDYFNEMFPSPEDEKEMYEWYDEKITNMSNKVDVKPISNGLEEANILYAQELEETKMLQEKEASIYDEIQRARQDNQEQAITSSTNAPSSSIEKTESDIQELKSAFEQEGDIVKSIVQEEANALASLFDAIMLVQEAVDVKTKAFQEEGDTVDSVLQGEVDSVNVLSLYVQSLKDDINDTFGSLSNDKNNFDGSNITDFIKKLSSGNADKIDTKLVTIFSSLSDFTDGINGLKINDDSILSSINNLLNKSKELENLAASIKAGKGQVKNVEKQTGGKQDSKTENSRVEEAVKLYNQLYEARYKLSKIKDGTNETFTADYNRQITEAEEGLKRLQLTEQERAEAEEKTSEKATKAINEELEAKRKLELNNKKLTESAEKTQQSVLKQATAFLSNGKVMREYGDRIHEIINEAKNLDIAFDPGEANSKLQALRKELDGIDNSAKIAGKSGQTFGQLLGQRFQALAAYLGTFASFYDIIRYIREAAQNVQELNKQMIELSKVSNQSINQIQKDFKSYSDTAKSIGATITDTISATADWARLGYGVPDAKELSRVALLYKNVGDGIDIEAANQSLISTLQGYQMQADEAEHIVDVFNEVANNYAIDTAGIGEALQRSAASLNAANTSLEQSVALVTAANTVVQNPESVGTTFKTLSARIRGATTELQELGEETDEYTETTSKLQGLVKSLTGFDILEDDQKTFKSIYDILIGIGKEWKNLDDIEQASLGEALAGKRNANTLYAILDNIDTLESAYETAEESSGSAMREQKNFEKGIEYSVNRIKASLEGLSYDALNTDLLKGIVDTGNTAINIVDTLVSNLGTLQTIIIGISGVVGSKKFGLLNYNKQDDKGGILGGLSIGGQGLSGLFTNQNKRMLGKESNQQFLEGLSDYWNDGSEAIKTYANSLDDVDAELVDFALKEQDLGRDLEGLNIRFEEAGSVSAKLTGVWKNLGSVAKQAGAMLVNALASMAVTAVISLAIKGVTSLIHNWEDLAKTTKEYGENYNSSKKTLTDYKNEISDLQNVLHDNSSTTEEVATATSRLYEIQNDLVSTYGSYAAGLDLVNGKLETQLGILDDIDKKNAQDAVNNIDSQRSAYSGTANFVNRYFNKGLNPFYGGVFGTATEGITSFVQNKQHGQSTGKALLDAFVTGGWYNEDQGNIIFGSTSDQITDSIESFTKSTKKIDSKKLESIKSLVETMDGVEIKHGALSFDSDINTAMDNASKLQSVLSKMNTDGSLDETMTDLTNIYNSASELNTNFGEQYNAIITDAIYGSDTLLEYYRSLQKAYDNIQVARDEGSPEEIKKANEDYIELINNINSANIGDKYKDYFKNLYPDLQNMISQWELEVKIVPELDDSSTELLTSRTAEDIQSLFVKYLSGGIDSLAEDEISGIEGLIKAYGDSEFTDPNLFLKAIKGISKYSDELVKVKDTLQNIWSNDRIDRFIDGLSDTQLEALMSLDLDEVAKVRTESQLKELIERAQRFSDKNPVKIQVSGVFGKSDALTTALGEQKSQGFLSDETLAGLKSNFADLNKELYTFTENGIMLNTEAMQEFTKQSAKAALVMAEMKEAIAVKEYNKEAKILKSMVSVNNNLKRAYDGGKKSLKEYLNTTKDLTKAQINSINAQLDKVDTLATEINNYDMLEARIRMATSALNEYIAATETPNLSDNFNTAKSAVDALVKSFEDGWTGTDEFREGMEYIAGYNFDPDIMEWGSGKYADDWATQVEQYITRAQRYFTEDVSGIYNFLDDAAEKTQGDLQNFISKSAEGVYTIDIENIDAFAQKMDMSVSAVMDMLLATEEAWDFDIDFGNVTDSIVDGLNEIDESTENSRTKLDDFKKSIEALEDAGYDVTDLWETYNEAVERSNPTLSIGIELSEKSKDEVMSEAQGLADKVSKEMGDAEISFNLDIEGTNKLIEQVQEYRSGLEAGSSQYEEATTVLAGLLQRKYELEQPAIMQVDTSQLSEETAGAMSLIQEFYSAVQEYQYQLEIGADTSDVEEKIATLQTNLQGISSTTLSNLGMGSIDFSGDFSKVYDELGKIDADSLVKNNKVKIKADSSDAQNTLNSFLNSVASSSATVKIKSTLSSDFSSTLQSQINASGTYSVSVHSSGSSGSNKSGKHKAAGGTVTRSEGDVLVGELGQELVARDGTYFTVGNNGAEMIPLKKGDIVFNAEQTAELLSRHKINSLGQIVGQSYAGGTSARGAGSGFTSGSSGWKKKNTSSSSSGSRTSGSSSNYSGNDSSVAEEAEETAETFDWIEVKIQRIEEEIARLDERVENTYELWSNRNQNLKSEIGSVTKEIDIQLAGYKRYLQEANSVGLSETYAKKVREGLIDIETIHNNEELVEKINLYQQWYDKAVECYDQIQTLQIRLGELYETNFEHTKDQYEQIISITEAYADLIDERINRTEEKGYFVSKKYYTDLANYEQSNINNLRKEYDELINKRNEAVKSGYITKDSEAFRNMNKDILDVAKAIEESTTQLVKFNNEMRQIDWDVFDYARERIGNVNNELEFLIDLLDNQKLYDDYGMFNNRGWADAALHASEYNIYMQQALDYANERAKIEQELAKDKYNKVLIERREELIKLQQESIQNSYAEKEAVRDLVEAGIDIHLKKLNETIEKYKRAIKDSRDLYDYQKKISEQTKNISNIQKQISAYQGDDSEEIRATIQKLRQNLEDAQTQLKETQWDKYISETETFLSDMYDQYEQTLNARLDDIDLLMTDMIDDINYHGSEIKNIISQVSGEVAYKLTENANTVISNGTIVSDFKNRFDTYATTTQQALNDIKSYVASMANKTVSTAVSTAKVETAPVATDKKITTTSPNQGTVQTFNNASENAAPNYHTMTKRVDFDAGIYNAIFDVNYYKNRYPDLQKAFGNDYGAYLNHFLTYGMKEGRQASETFDVNYYKSKYEDLQKAFGSNLKAYYEHFLTYGIKEGRQGSSTFNAQTYKKLYKDLQDAYGNNLSSYYAHYNRWGAGENRKHYASGTKSASNEIAWTNEGALYGNGGEIIYRKSDGAMLTPLHNGDKVFTAQMSDNLWNLAKLNINPNNVPTGTAVRTVNNQNAISITLPNVSNYNEFKAQLKNDPNMTKFIQEITLGEVSTGVKLNKRKL